MTEVWYWVCPKGQHDEYGKIVKDFQTLRHYFILFSIGDNLAEVWTTGAIKTNITDKFLELEMKYRKMRKELKEDIETNLSIPFDDD